MRPSEGSLSSLRTLLCMAACLVLIGLLAASQVVAQKAQPAPAVLPPSQAATKTPIQPTKKVEANLLVQESKFGMLLISGKLYYVWRDAKFYDLGGKQIPVSGVKANDVVNVEYLTGGTRSEQYQYSPSQRVITNLRVVAKGKK